MPRLNSPPKILFFFLLSYNNKKKKKGDSNGVKMNIRCAVIIFQCLNNNLGQSSELAALLLLYVSIRLYCTLSVLGLVSSVRVCVCLNGFVAG